MTVIPAWPGEAGRVASHSQIHSELETSLGYKRACLTEQNQTEPKTEPNLLFLNLSQFGTLNVFISMYQGGNLWSKSIKDKPVLS